MLFDHVVNGVGLLPGCVEIEPAIHNLNAEVIFFVDHQAEFFFGMDRDRPSAVTVGVLTTNQLSFDKKLTIDLRQQFQIDVADILQLGLSLKGLVQRSFDRV